MRISVAASMIGTLSLALAACGGGNGGAVVGSTTTTTSSSTASGGSTITAADFMFTPNTLTVLPGAKVTLTFQNTGTTTHNFTQSDLGLNQDVAAGASTSITFTAPASGTLNFHCMYHPTRMTGTIVVGTPGAATGPSSPPSSTSSAAGYGPGY